MLHSKLEIMAIRVARNEGLGPGAMRVPHSERSWWSEV